MKSSTPEGNHQYTILMHREPEGNTHFDCYLTDDGRNTYHIQYKIDSQGNIVGFTVVNEPKHTILNFSNGTNSQKLKKLAEFIHGRRGNDVYYHKYRQYPSNELIDIL